MEQGEPATKRVKHSIISEHIYQPEFQEIFSKHWHDRSSIKTLNLEVIAEPFRVCKISNFIKNEEFMDDIKNELLDVKTRRNSMDLYQFEQSKDLSDVNKNNVKTLFQTFQTDLVSWMEKNTKIELNRKISMSSTCYSDTDYLLCHDDNLSDRRIAFILYLSKNWTEEDGGTLDLFDSDENGHPTKVVKSLIPEYNSLVFFEVVDNSYHQVAEITSPVKGRWSINGWFHGPLLEDRKPERTEQLLNFLQPEITEFDLNSWISKMYLNPSITKEIQEDVEQKSCAFLQGFLNNDIYSTLCEELESDSIKWKRVGPANVRNYEIAEEDSLPETLADFYKLFKSITICQLLKNYTELELVPENELMNPKMTIELQRWTKGCYTLVNDRHTYQDDAPATIDEIEPDPSQTDTPATIDEIEPDPNQADTIDVALDAPSSSKTPTRPSNYTEESSLSDKKLSEDTGCNTPPSSQDGDDEEEDEVEAKKRKIKNKSPRGEGKRPMVQQSSSSEAETISETQQEQQKQIHLRNLDTDDSDVSDIGDYLSDPLDRSDEEEQPEEEASAEEQPEEEASVEEQEPGSLDLVIQFHTSSLSKIQTIDYVDLREEEGALISVPPKDNHLCLVYKTLGTCRVHKFINHYFKGAFYNLVCTYYE
ncbi:prolyl 3-hydroxylase OGFOD1 [Nasonia vitripennis]|uniref:uS12 prolyl 3-hydroxylase n=1 Tax=Nasonia vitripennis TaxID=7425 RepID=A0A7M7QDC0_NASVI|nr:prolyl 3-hydroxylase OGFOD1 [Nasonia vitripennis]XP_031784916.1 prolyl 3-hydroxylase OGFOD1 [Nasonia vitripennis]